VIPAVLAVAGLDPTGGAGLLADAEAIRAAGGVPRVACTALTAQDDMAVRAVEPVGGPFLRQQIAAAGPVAAVKVGMLGTAAVAEALVAAIDEGLPRPVIDPVLAASAGQHLLDRAGLRVLRTQLLQRAAAITPNLAEATTLTGIQVRDPTTMEDACRALVHAGCGLAVVTGGHLAGGLIDVVLVAGQPRPVRLERTRVPGSARGTGCRFSAYLATRLALGDDPVEAVRAAGEHVAAYVLGRTVSRS
jgi:hydroxymethylpyrimidine/phosphomethylpyrimidine kinase